MKLSRIVTSAALMAGLTFIPIPAAARGGGHGGHSAGGHSGHAGSSSGSRGGSSVGVARAAPPSGGVVRGAALADGTMGAESIADTAGFIARTAAGFITVTEAGFITVTEAGFITVTEATTQGIIIGTDTYWPLPTTASTPGSG